MTRRKTILGLFAQLFGRGDSDTVDLRELVNDANRDLDDDRVRVRLGDGYARAGQNTEAITWYWEAARINVRCGRQARATALMKRVLAIDPRCVRALVEIARAEQAKENYREAARYYRAAAQIRQQDGYAEEAHGLFRRAIEMDRRGAATTTPFPFTEVGMAA